MNKSDILRLRKEISSFIKSDQKVFEFKIDCPLKDRIKNIYSIIFPGNKKYKFYFNFMIARIARMIDYSPIKVFLYRLIGMKIGKGVFISPDVMLDPHFPSLIEIEDYAIIGWGSSIFTHEFSNNIYRLGKIKIKKGAIIGALAVVKCGVTIGEESETYAFIAVPRDIPDKTRYGITREQKFTPLK